jgi:hypothetical protein
VKILAKSLINWEEIPANEIKKILRSVTTPISLKFYEVFEDDETYQIVDRHYEGRKSC